jgi:hypothetical protein
MYSMKSLKPVLPVTETHVECPVAGCAQTLKRQRNTFQTTDEFRCPEHHIYISPSTFEYKDFHDNLLWTSDPDLRLLDAIKQVKRESRMARDNSEDALTWNVFRFLEQSALLGGWLESITDTAVRNPKIKYWSYCPEAKGTWPPLDATRRTFGETPKRDSEPDLIVETDDAIYWIEAKFLSGNETHPSNPNDSKQYITGGERWFDRVFKSPFGVVAVAKNFYELTRFWLLGSWGAAQGGKRFYLINLVRSQKELAIEREFGAHIIATDDRQFKRATWEDIYRFILESDPRAGCTRVLEYMKDKSAGYSALRKIVLAFAIPVP